MGNTPAEAGAGDGRDVLLPTANAGTAMEQLRGTELAGWAAGKFRRRGRRRATARRAQPARPANMSYVIDEEGYAVLDESAFLGWDSSGSSDSGRTSEITKWSVH